MKRTTIISIAFLALALALGLGAAAQDAGTVQGSGTAFVVHPDGYLLTCEHVVRGATGIKVTIGQRTWDAVVLAADALHDIALIQIDAEGLPALPLANSNAVRTGEDVRVCGFPLSPAIGSNLKVTRGTVSGIAAMDAAKTFQVDAPVNPGNSGGPLVNEKGQVIGIVNAKLAAQGIEGVGFAVPVNYARALLAGDFVAPRQAADSDPALDGPAIVKSVSPSVAFVLVQSVPPSVPAWKTGTGDGSAEAGQADIIEAREFDLVDGDGYYRASLGFSDDGVPGFWMYGENGETAISLTFSKGGRPGLWLCDEDGNEVARIVLSANGATFDILDPERDITTIQILSDREKGEEIRLWGSEDKMFLRAVSDSEGAWLAIWDSEDNLVWTSQP